jgi:hypothetical protein
MRLPKKLADPGLFDDEPFQSNFMAWHIARLRKSSKEARVKSIADQIKTAEGGVSGTFFLRGKVLNS